MSLTECRLELEIGECRSICPAFPKQLPDGVFVRGVPGGSLEQVVFYLDILHALKLLGIPVYNDGRAIERTVDKGMTSFLLAAGRHPHTADLGAERCRRGPARSPTGNWAPAMPSSPSRCSAPRATGCDATTRLDDLAAFSADNGVFYLQRFVASGDATPRFSRLRHRRQNRGRDAAVRRDLAEQCASGRALRTGPTR